MEAPQPQDMHDAHGPGREIIKGGNDAPRQAPRSAARDDDTCAHAGTQAAEPSGPTAAQEQASGREGAVHNSTATRM